MVVLADQLDALPADLPSSTTPAPSALHATIPMCFTHRNVPGRSFVGAPGTAQCSRERPRRVAQVPVDDRRAGGGARRARPGLGLQPRRYVLTIIAIFLAAAVPATYTRRLIARCRRAVRLVGARLTVTVIEVALIVTLMISADFDASTSPTTRSSLRRSYLQRHRRPVVAGGRVSGRRRDLQRRGHGDGVRHSRRAGHVDLVLQHSPRQPGPVLVRTADVRRVASLMLCLLFMFGQPWPVRDSFIEPTATTPPSTDPSSGQALVAWPARRRPSHHRRAGKGDAGRRVHQRHGSAAIRPSAS